MARIGIKDIQALKQGGEKIVMLTAYDYPSAQIAEAAGVDMILVGDSLGMVVLGYDDTIKVTLDDMLHHSKAVARGSERAMLVTDLPFMTYQTSLEDAMRNAGRLLQEGGAQAVKLEGGVHMAETVRRLVQVGIPVVGHIGLTPQSINQLGGYKVQGRTPQEAERMLEDAVALQQAGAFCLVLETVPAPLAELITQRLTIPVIGIGAGASCDGQVLVWHDLLSYQTSFLTRHIPRHVKEYAHVGEDMQRAIEQYAAEVRNGSFPSPEQSFQMNPEALAELTQAKN